ncbi:MAG: UvrD-helicase domain-containing protein [Verrucomicrobiales bacterium]|nr:UvrD-helicase domain-containing protein [Verrucomicrobiales bacterium]
MAGFTGTLNPQQREAATHIHGPLLILAGAGTGKTRVITARIAHMVAEGIDPAHILAVTFTNKAASEMRERVKDMVRGGKGSKVVLGTFHAFCARLLREHAAAVGYKNNFVIYSQSEQSSLLKRLITRLLTKEESRDPAAVQARISWAKNNGETLGDPERDVDAAIMAAYQQEMRALNVMDFDDLLLLGVQALEEDAEVRSLLHDRHRYVLVDEFQDTNSLQMRLLRALVPAPYNVCVVGDDDQSIYGWRGAEITNITEFERFFPNPKIVKLEENYRSTTPILHTANSLIVHNIGRRPKRLWSRLPGQEPVRLIVAQDDKEESKMVASEIAQANATTHRPWEDFAVLFRTNDQSRILEQEFRERKIPYRVVGARSFFDRREVKDVVAYLRVIHNPHDDISLLRILNTPPRGIGAATAELARDRSVERSQSIWVSLCEDDFQRQLPQRARAAVGEFISLVSRYYEAAHTQGTFLAKMSEHLLHEIDYLDWLRRGAKDPEDCLTWENGVRGLLDNLQSFDEKDRLKGLGGFLDQISLDDSREDKDDITAKQGVCLITLHASKGLEFPIVYLPGVEKDILPHRRSYLENRLDEERRLFYVGITRAQQKLTLSWVRFRTKWGQKQTCLPSPFLQELDMQYVQQMDYTRHLKEAPPPEEKASFFDSLKAALREGDAG